MIKLSKKEYLDKLHACRLGKNIGGTMGAPYEGARWYIDINGFATKGGEPMPNNDLDLQKPGAWADTIRPSPSPIRNRSTAFTVWKRPPSPSP